MRIMEPKCSGQEFLHNRGLEVVLWAVEQEANVVEQLLIRGEGSGTGLRGSHWVIHVGL
jgi:hypothetical protein